MNLRVALRSLRKSPGFTLVAILTLTLGIGAVSAMFSVVNAVLLKPLAGVETDRLLKLWEKSPVGIYAHPPAYHEWRKLTSIFEEVGGTQYNSPSLTGSGEPQQLAAARVTASWFVVQRATPLIGRTFLPDEDQHGGAPVVILDYGFWLRRFGGDRSLVGHAITLDQKPTIVVGIMPQDFLPLGKGPDIYTPYDVDGNKLAVFEATARLRPAVTIEQARAAIAVVEASLAKAAPGDYNGIVAEAEPLRETVVGSSRDLLRLLLAASALVLLVACVNVANLFLARGAAKRRETEIREFLGATRRQLLAPALTESALISFAGGALGLLAAWAATRVLAVRVENFPRVEEIAVDTRVVLATLALCILTVLACGATSTFLKKRIAKNILVIAEVALTFVLLICSGLLIRSFASMRQVDLGYNPNGVILGFVSQPADPQDKREKAIALWQRIRERMSGMPEIAAVATTTATPAGGVNASFPVIREGEDIARAANQPTAGVVIASGDYFKVAAIPLRAGRTFSDHDSAGVVIVSQAIADRYFAGDALHHRIQLPSFDYNVTALSPINALEIIGVAGDVKQKSVAETDRMTLYLPESQNALRYTHIFVRVKAGDPMRLEHALRRVVFEEAPQLTLGQTLPLDAANAYLTRAPLRAMWLLGVFAALALILAGIGVHGVVAYATAQRSREMGIRMALGARPSQLFGLIIRHALRLAIAGAAIGVAAAWACSKLLQTLLFGVGRADPVTYASGAAILIAIAIAASFTPALRAARTDPSITLRAE
jgi:putative ABC transport system permease protein